MVLFDRDPFQIFRGTPGFDGLFRAAEQLAHRAGPATRSAGFHTGAFDAPANLTATDAGAHLTVLVPGFGPDDVEVSVRRAHLHVTGAVKDDEGSTLRSFERSFRLPFPVDVDAVAAQVENGVLELELPRSESDRPRTIRIEGAGPRDAEVLPEADGE
ncbi:MAG: Hsp20/alpha crystallin family protein [Planctomycetota bacterium]